MQHTARQKAAYSLLQNEFKRRKNKDSRYSFRAFAHVIGVSQSQLSLIISGKRQLSLALSIRIAQLFADDLRTFEEVTGFQLTDFVRSKSLVVVTQYERHQPQNLPLTDEDRSKMLETGTVIPVKDWEAFSKAVSKGCRQFPQGSIAFRFLK